MHKKKLAGQQLKPKNRLQDLYEPLKRTLMRTTDSLVKVLADNELVELPSSAMHRIDYSSTERNLGQNAAISLSSKTIMPPQT